MEVLVVHRVGELNPPTRSCWSWSRERTAASLCRLEFIMDYLKTRAPFWKKEQTPQGARWVEARASDGRLRSAGNAQVERRLSYKAARIRCSPASSAPMDKTTDPSM